MPPIERARRLSRSLQARFRIDLFSALVEREFERRLAEAILDAEREAYRRGREEALAGPGVASLDVDGGVSPSPRSEAAARPAGRSMTM
ncbi:hypothetical protein JHL17_16210 [Azospirillum sp. YIM B02556]|uniref:Uncharacterized protein n=1 Tax=Azospirillum endophyticum TaxID=2800326 RepID=A0ABS1F6B3_9PROT|nr:hypothetical protein [Azospirillum endophyticum]MBK1838961.1 hypothetical protein [Azospirillum endophyticum]